MISNRIVQKNSTTTFVNKLWGWGDNTGKVIKDSGASFTSPVQNDDNESWTMISHGNNFACGIDSNNKLFCWGKNTYGQLGDGTTTDRSNAVSISGNWNMVSCGLNHVAAINTSNKLYCWGRNNTGQLGDNTRNNRSSPVLTLLGATPNWIKISCGTEFTLAIDSANNLYSWGTNGDGQLGLSNTADYSAPQLVNFATGKWTDIKACQYHSLGLNSQYTAGFLSWGRNGSGQLGTSNTTSYLYPKYVMMANKIDIIKGAGYSSAIINSSNGLYTFGENYYGQLGLGTWNNYQITPQYIGGNITAIEMIGYKKYVSTFALYTSQYIYSTGFGSSGRLGNGVINRSNFTQVSGTNKWTSLSNSGQGQSFMMALKL